VRQAAHDYRKADLDSRTRALRDFAVKLTGHPAAVGRADVEALRAVGIEDEPEWGR